MRIHSLNNTALVSSPLLLAQEKKEKMDKNKEITHNPITTASKLFFVGEGDNTMFRILIQIQFGLLLIRIQEGKNNQQKKKTMKKFFVVSCSFWGT